MLLLLEIEDAITLPLPSSCLGAFPRLRDNACFSAILMDHDVHEITDGWESEHMQSEKPVRNSSEEVYTSAEPLPQHADAVPLVPINPSTPRRRLNREQ